MQRFRISEIDDIPMATATPVPGWMGGEVSRSTQPMLAAGDSKWVRAFVVTFGKGASTGWHTHDSDQILVITAGNGIVANESEELDVAVGDVVQILPGENHWHGATKDSTMSHLSVVAVTE